MAETNWRDQQRYEAETQSDKDHSKLLNDYLTTFGSEAGKNVLLDLIRQSNMPSVSYEKLTSEIALVKEGKRIYLDYILKRISTVKNDKQ